MPPRNDLAAPLGVEPSAEAVEWPAGFDPECRANCWLLSGKMRVLHALLRQVFAQGERVVVASFFSSMLNLIEDMCEQMRWPTLRIDGKVPSRLRQQRVEKFNGKASLEDVFALLLTTEAGGGTIAL